jgi:hypothetical protein
MLKARRFFLAALLLLLLFSLFTSIGQNIWLSGLMLPNLLPDSRIRPLEWVTGKPQVKRVEIPFGKDVLTADLYLPASLRPTSKILLAIHGANQQGKDDVRIVTSGDTFARAGIVTLIPDFPDITPQRFTPQAREEIVAAYDWMMRHLPGRRSGMIAFSVASGPMFLAATDTRISHQIDYLISFGGYYELKEVLRQATSTNCDPYGFWVANQQLANLSGGDKSLQRLLNNKDPAQFDTLFDALSANVRGVIRDLTPAGKLEGIQAEKVFLLHSDPDPLIPTSEIVRLQQALGSKANIVILKGFSHVTPTLPTPTCRDVFTFYVPEFLKLYRVTFSILNL